MCQGGVFCLEHNMLGWLDGIQMPEKWDWGDIPTNSEETLEKVKQIWKDAKEYEPPEEPEEVTEQSDYIYCNTQEKFMNINHGFFLTEKGYKNAMRRSLGNTNGVNEFSRYSGT